MYFFQQWVSIGWTCKIQPTNHNTWPLSQTLSQAIHFKETDLHWQFRGEFVILPSHPILSLSCTSLLNWSLHHQKLFHMLAINLCLLLKNKGNIEIKNKRSSRMNLIIPLWTDKMYLKNRIGSGIWLRQTSNPIKRKICKLKWFQLREKCIMSHYSRLSPCGHLAITDTPIIQTAAESLAKNYRHFDWNKLPTLRTYRHLSWSRHGYQSAPFNILAVLSQFIIYFFLFLSSSLSRWLKSEHSDSLLLWSFYETTVLTSGLDVATCGVANVTRFYSVATKFSSLVANLAPKICDLSSLGKRKLMIIC